LFASVDTLIEHAIVWNRLDGHGQNMSQNQSVILKSVFL